MGRVGKIVVLAVATVVLAGGAGVLLVEVADRVDTEGGDDAGPPFAAVVEPSDAVLDALDDEAAATSLELMGADALVHGPALTLPETRRATDESVARLRTSLDDRDDVAGHYQQAVDALRGLQTLRDEVDAATGPRDFSNTPYAEQVVDRYRELAAPVDEAQRTGILRIDDPALRDGLTLASTAGRQNRIIASLVHDLLLASTTSGGLDERAEITAVARQLDELTTNVEVIKGVDRSPYREMVERSFPEQLTADLSAVVEGALAGQPTDVPQLLTIVDVPPDQSYLGLRSEARSEAIRQADRDAGSSSDRSLLLWLVALTVTAALAVGAFVALLVVASGRRPAPMSPHSLPPPGFPPPPVSP